VANIRVDKITVGSPDYKVIVGDYTKVLKVVVGVPTRNVLVSNSVLLNDVVGITTSNIQEGDILIADSDGILVNRPLTANKIDGKVYERDVERGQILIRRSPTDGVPTTLYSGELAYSYLPDPSYGGGGNGGDRLYFGVGSDGNELAERIDVIGGKYFTDLLSHTHGINTPNTAAIVDSAKRINEWFVDALQADSATITNLSVTSINAADLIANLLDNITEGVGIDIRESDGKIVIAAEFATATNAGIVSLDSTQFSVGGTGQTEITTLDGGFF